MNLTIRTLCWALACFLLHTSVSGQITWRKTFGFNGDESGSAVHQTSDGGYIVVGTTGTSWQGGSDIYFIKLDSNGSLEWSRTYGTAGVETGVECAELADGYIIAGNSSEGGIDSYDMMLVRTDLLGNELWRQHYGKQGWDFCNGFDLLVDGFVLAGITYGPGSTIGNMFIVRTDFDGDTLWTQTLTNARKTECLGIAATSDQGFLLGGYINNAAGNDDALLTKVNQFGVEEWSHITVGSGDEQFEGVMENAAGTEYIGAGGSTSFGVEVQIYLEGFTTTGSSIWTQSFGPGAGATDVEPDHNGGYVITGFNSPSPSENDIILTVLNPGGGFGFGNNFGNGNDAVGNSIEPTADGGYVVAGWAREIGPGVRSFFVVKTDGAGQTANSVIDANNDISLDVNELTNDDTFFSIRPNVLNIGDDLQLMLSSEIDQRVDYRIFNHQGKLVNMGSAVDRNVRIPTSVGVGQYVIHLTSKNRTFTSKFVVLP